MCDLEITIILNSKKQFTSCSDRNIKKISNKYINRIKKLFFSKNKILFIKYCKYCKYSEY